MKIKSLADVLEKSLRKSHKVGKIIRQFFVSLPGFTWEAGLIYTKTELEKI